MSDSHDPEKTADVQAADVPLRRIVLAGLTLVGLVGCFLVLKLEAYFQELQRLSKTDLVAAAGKVQQLSAVVLISLGAVTVLFGIYLISLAVRVIRGERFPPPGARVINDTKILRGAAAKRYGMAAMVLALAILVAGVAIPWKAHQKLDRVLAISLEPTPQTPEELGLQP